MFPLEESIHSFPTMLSPATAVAWGAPSECHSSKEEIEAIRFAKQLLTKNPGSVAW